MLLSRRHHCPLNVRLPTFAPNAIACSGDGSKGDTPRSTMMTNTSTFNPIIPVVIGKEGVTRARPEVGTPARAICARRSSHSGQFSEDGEPPKLRSNSLPHCGQLCMGIKNNSSFYEMAACSQE